MTRGLDAARAVAVAGIVIVDFELAMFAGERGPGWLRAAVGVLEGRAAAALVILAGAGASLLAAGRERHRDALRSDRSRMLRRAGILAVAGYLFIPIWPGDLLHHYALFVGLGALLLAASDRALWGWAAAAAAAFALLYTFAGYWDQMDPVDLAYRGLWSPVGLVRDLVFNGWHPLLPWMAFYLVGMWLGRRDLWDARVRRRIIGAAAMAAAGAEVVASFFQPITFDIVTTGPASLGLQAGNRALLAAEMVPPGPVFVLAAGGTALVVIMLCVEVAERLPSAAAVRAAASFGRMALTVYFGHVVLGLGTLSLAGRLHSQPLWFAVACALAFLAAAAVFVVWWRRRFEVGPVEALLHRLGG